jgi:GT2 family glycosyltransferase
VIVLNWNGREDSIACLESLKKVDYPNYDVMLVDNGSVDGSAAAISRRFPGLEIIETGRNLGFAEGNNTGIRIALDRGVNYVFLLNNDTVAHPSLLRELVAAGQRCPEGGIFSAKIYHHAQPTRIWYGGAAWHERWMRFQHFHDEADIRADDRGVAAVDYACGCALLARSAMLRKVGLLDPRFFLTFEDTDLCFRARRAGFAVYYVPAAVLWHKISASFGGAESPLHLYFMTRNLLLWGERHLGLRQLLRLYGTVWRELMRELLPKSGTDTATEGSVNQYSHTIFSFASVVRKRLREPKNQARAWAILHYVIRRFGDAPEHVRRLARPSPHASH